MAFVITDLKTLSQRSRNSFKTYLKGSDAWLWPSNIYVVAKVLAGMTNMLFMRLKWINKQRFVSTCTDWDELKLHGSELGINQKQASASQGYVNVYVTYPYTVNSGEVLTRSDGVTYTVTKTTSAVQYATLDYVEVPVVCTKVGKTGNTLAGTQLTTTMVDSSNNTILAYVGDAGLGQGTDAETFEQLQARILFRKRNPPAAGAEHDYIAWATSVPGVTRAFVKGNAFGYGTVGVWFLMDDTYSFGIPLAADVAAVQAYIDSVKPVGATTVVVQAPTPDCIDIVVKGVSPDTQAMRNSIAAELLATFRRMTQPGVPGTPFTLRWSWLQQAVDNATGEQYNEGVTAPSTDLTFTAGIMPCINSVKFVS
jgi:uncharacterized phage protein gp47/JayE